MEVINHHPQVEWIWNYYPFSMFAILPLREGLNLITLETNRLFFFIPQNIWNTIPELGVITLVGTWAWVAFYDFLVFYKP